MYYRIKRETGSFSGSNKPSSPRTGRSSASSSYGARPASSSSYGARSASSSYGSRSSSASSSYGAPRSSFRGGSRGGNFSRGNSRGNRFANQKIDVSRYMNKAEASAPAVEYIPTNTFADFKIENNLKQNIISKGYITPTPIQDQSIPVVLEGKDIFGIANTGTGKTAAFLIPLINKVLLNKREQVLIVAPTKELAQQIAEEFDTFAKGLGMHSLTCIGGSPIGRQLSWLRYHNEFIIGTPGRIKDLIERRALDLSNFKTVVLDEADRMLDMGFIGDMKLLMAKMSPQKQTLFFSATLSPEVDRLVKDFLKDPVRISVKTQDTAKNIEQDVVRVPAGVNKFDHLHDMLTKDEFEKVLIFGRTKHGVEKISDALLKKGHKAVSIHGNKNLGQRQRALEDFKNNRVKVMVATDVAARGLDIADVSHVINFDIPATHEDYIHRIGRTGRANKKGKALTFID